MRGPIDYIIVKFKNKKVDGSILDAVGDAVDSGAINLLELAAVQKDADGAVTNIDIMGTGDDYLIDFAEKRNVKTGAELDDVAEIGELLEPGEMAGFLVVEQLWAIPLKKALLAANAELLAEGRIHPDAAAEFEK